MRHAPARRKAYSVANALADAEIASEIYSTAGDFDLLVKFYVEHGTDIGHFVKGPDHSGHSGHQDNHHVQGVLGRLAVVSNHFCGVIASLVVWAGNTWPETLVW